MPIRINVGGGDSITAIPSSNNTYTGTNTVVGDIGSGGTIKVLIGASEQIRSVPLQDTTRSIVAAGEKLPVIIPNSVVLGTDTIGDYIKSVFAGDGIDITYSANTGLESANITISHSDTSSEISSNNDVYSFIQNVDIDQFGHVTQFGTASLSANNFFSKFDGNIIPRDMSIGDTIFTLGDSVTSLEGLTYISTETLDLSTSLIIDGFIGSANGDLILAPFANNDVSVSGSNIVDLADPFLDSHAVNLNYLENRFTRTLDFVNANNTFTMQLLSEEPRIFVRDGIGVIFANNDIVLSLDIDANNFIFNSDQLKSQDILIGNTAFTLGDTVDSIENLGSLSVENFTTDNFTTDILITANNIVVGGTISSANGDLVLVANGVVSVSGSRISDVGAPLLPNDAINIDYLDNIFDKSLTIIEGGNTHIMSLLNNDPTLIIGNALTVDFTNNALSLGLRPTGVDPDIYGDDGFSPVIRVDADGRVIFATQIPINVGSGNIIDFSESTRDVVGEMFRFNVEEGISIVHNDPFNVFDVRVDNFDITLDGGVSGTARVNRLSNTTITTVLTGDHITDITGSPSITVTGTPSANATFNISHGDTSPVVNTNFTGPAVIQNLTFDEYGHVQTIGAANLDFRYLNLGGGTLFGDLYAPRMIDSNDNDFRVDPSGESVFNGLHVGFGQTQSFIQMQDSLTTSSYLFAGEQRIGFLNGGFNFVAYSDKINDNWVVEFGSVLAQSFVDVNDSAYFVSPSNIDSRLRGLSVDNSVSVGSDLIIANTGISTILDNLVLSSGSNIISVDNSIISQVGTAVNGLDAVNLNLLELASANTVNYVEQRIANTVNYVDNQTANTIVYVDSQTINTINYVDNQTANTINYVDAAILESETAGVQSRAGDGLLFNANTNAFDVSIDNTTLQIVNDVISVRPIIANGFIGLLGDTGSDQVPYNEFITFTGGQGITTTASNNQIVIDADIANTSSLGVSFFNENNFAVTGLGEVSISAVDGNNSQLLLKRSDVIGNVPTTAELAFGEVQLNTEDGKIFIKRLVGAVETVVEFSADPQDILNLIATVDGSGSGLDADVLDGQDGSFYLDYGNFTNIPVLTGQQVLDLISTVDGQASGLDADFLDGQTGSFFLNYDNFFNTPPVQIIVNANTILSDLLTVDGSGSGLDSDLLDGQEGSFYLDFNNFTNTPNRTPEALLASISTVDGAGSGLDADLLDGQDGFYYLDYNNFANTPPENLNLTLTGDITGSAVSSNGAISVLTELSDTGVAIGSYGSATRVPIFTVDVDGRITTATTVPVADVSTTAGIDRVEWVIANNELSIYSTNNDIYSTVIDTFQDLNVNANITVGGTVDGRDVATDGSKLDGITAGATPDQSPIDILTALLTVDGSGSGLDADVLDGQTGSFYLDYNNFANIPTAIDLLTLISTVDGSGSGLDADLLDGANGSFYLDFNNFINTPADITGAEILGLLLPVDGSGSGLDADLLDGNDSTFFTTYTDDQITNRVSNSAITISSGAGLTGTGTFGLNQTALQTITINHANTSDVANVAISGDTVISTVSFDEFGHVVNVGTRELDYINQAQADIRYVNVTGDIMTGSLEVQDNIIQNESLFASQGVTAGSTFGVFLYGFSATLYGAAEVIITAQQGINRHITKMLITHDGTTAWATEYGTIYTDVSLTDYDVDLIAGDVYIVSTAPNATNINFKIVSTLISS